MTTMNFFKVDDNYKRQAHQLFGTIKRVSQQYPDIVADYNDLIHNGNFIQAVLTILLPQSPVATLDLDKHQAILYNVDSLDEFKKTYQNTQFIADNVDGNLYPDLDHLLDQLNFDLNDMTFGHVEPTTISCLTSNDWFNQRNNHTNTEDNHVHTYVISDRRALLAAKSFRKQIKNRGFQYPANPNVERALLRLFIFNFRTFYMDIDRVHRPVLYTWEYSVTETLSVLELSQKAQGLNYKYVFEEWTNGFTEVDGTQLAETFSNACFCHKDNENQIIKKPMLPLQRTLMEYPRYMVSFKAEFIDDKDEKKELPMLCDVITFRKHLKLSDDNEVLQRTQIRQNKDNTIEFKLVDVDSSGVYAYPLNPAAAPSEVEVSATYKASDDPEFNQK